MAHTSTASLQQRLKATYGRVKSVLKEALPRHGATLNNQSMTTRDISALLRRHHLAGLLPYRYYDPDTSLFHNARSLGFMLDVTPVDGATEEMINILHNMITDILPDYCDLQCLLVASDKVSPQLTQFKQARSEQQGLYAWLVDKRMEFFKQGVYQPISAQSQTVLRDFCLYITVSLPRKRIDADELLMIREKMIKTLSSINILATRITIENFLSQLSALISPYRTPEKLSKNWQPLTTLDLQLTDPECFLTVEKEKLHFAREHEATDVCCLVAKEIPSHPSQWKAGDNLGQMFNNALQIPYPFVISMNVRVLPREPSVARYQLKSLSKGRDVNSPLVKLFPFLRHEYEDAKYMFDHLKEGGKAVKYHYQVVLYAPPEKINEAEQGAKDLFNANGWRLNKPSGFQLPSWMMMLPMATSEGLYEEMERMGCLKEVTALNAVNMMPLQAEWKGTKTPSTLLVGRRGQISHWNPFDNPQGNYNMCIIAKSGSGKSVFAQEYIVSMLSQGGRVWVIDAGRSYEKTCRLLGGTFVEFAPNTTINMNPFSSIVDINMSMEMLKPMIASMARINQEITDEELSYIEMGINAAWDGYGQQATITHVSEWLKSQDDPIAKTLALLLFPYTKAGQYSAFFEGESNIDLDNDFVVLELDDLKNRKDLQRVILMVLIYHITQAMFLGNRDQRKNCILEELWDMFSGSHNKLAGEFIAAGVRTARRFGGGMVGISQLFSDFYKNDMTRAMYDNSDFKIILSQTHESIEQAKEKKYLHMDPYTEHVLKSLRTVSGEYSEFAIQGPHGLSVHRLYLDPYSSLLYSSRAEEFQFIRDMEAQGTPLVEALAMAVRKFKNAA